MIDPNASLALSAALFSVGIVGVFARRSIFSAFLSLELMLCATVLALTSFDLLHSQSVSPSEVVMGRGAAVLILSVALAQAVIGLGLLIASSRNRVSDDGVSS